MADSDFTADATSDAIALSGSIAAAEGGSLAEARAKLGPLVSDPRYTVQAEYRNFSTEVA